MIRSDRHYTGAPPFQSRKRSRQGAKEFRGSPKMMRCGSGRDHDRKKPRMTLMNADVLLHLILFICAYPRHQRFFPFLFLTCSRDESVATRGCRGIHGRARSPSYEDSRDRCHAIDSPDGRQFAGILKSEDPKQLSLMTPEGKLITLDKSHIDERSTGKSSMPEDVAKPLSKSDLRDLVEFLSSLR